ncbi:MAG: hypothetical protein L0271_21110 [Gemmatimonadetes bacterium]|nr:hypothetical protein [Gemmatimonadota bacterium]
MIPAVDDGAQTDAEATAALEAMRDDGVHIVIATPHVEASAGESGGVATQRLSELDAGWAALQRLAGELEHITVRRGAEVRLDTPDPDLSDARLRLDGGVFALVEFSFFVVPPRSARVLERIVEDGWTPILAHPERYSGLDPELSVVDEWLGAGACLQVNGPSLLGRYGAEIRSVAERLLARGAASYVSSDYHARGAPRIKELERLLHRAGGAPQADRLLRENPARMLRGEAPLEVPPLAVPSTAGAD